MADAEVKAHNKTDKLLSKYEKRIQDIYKAAEREMRVKWDKYMNNAAKRIERLQAAYDDAVASGDQDEIQRTGEALGRAKNAALSQDKRYKDMVAEMAEQYAHANETATAYINGQMADVYALNYNSVGEKINDEIQGGISYNLVDRHTVEALVHDDKLLLPKKSVNIPKDIRWNEKLINGAVMQGILQGESIPKIAKRLSQCTDMTQAAAVRNARTMTTAAENRGRQNGMEDARNLGIRMKKEWLATRDARTRDSHASANGQQAEVDKPFVVGGYNLMFPADPSGPAHEVYNCRCTVLTRVLGFDKLNIQQQDQNQNDVYSIGKEPVRPKRSDYESDDAYQEARDKYREERKEYRDKFDKIVNDEYDSITPMSEKEFREWASNKGFIIEDEDKNGYYGSKFDNISNVDEKALTVFAERMNYLIEEFPFVEDFFKASNGYKISKTTDMNYLAEASGGFTFGAEFIDYKQVIATNLENHVSGYRVKGSGINNQLIDHEFGHNLFDSIVFSDGHNSIELGNKLIGLCANAQGRSEYSSTNVDELAAEAFSAWLGGEDTEFARNFGKWLKDIDLKNLKYTNWERMLKK